jgi:hypothetical protein
MSNRFWLGRKHLLRIQDENSSRLAVRRRAWLSRVCASPQRGGDVHSKFRFGGPVDGIRQVDFSESLPTLQRQPRPIGVRAGLWVPCKSSRWQLPRYSDPRGQPGRGPRLGCGHVGPAFRKLSHSYRDRIASNSLAKLDSGDFPLARGGNQ